MFLQSLKICICSECGKEGLHHLCQTGYKPFMEAEEAILDHVKSAGNYLCMKCVDGAVEELKKAGKLTSVKANEATNSTVEPPKTPMQPPEPPAPASTRKSPRKAPPPPVQPFHCVSYDMRFGVTYGMSYDMMAI